LEAAYKESKVDTVDRILKKLNKAELAAVEQKIKARMEEGNVVYPPSS
jgi:hypothetical protein